MQYMYGIRRYVVKYYYQIYENNGLMSQKCDN